MVDTFGYDGWFYDIPKDFEFPKKVSLEVGVRFWLSGLSVGSDRNFIKPFRLIKTKFLPTKKLKDDFKLQYLGVFKLMKSSDIYLPPLDSRLIFQATRDIIYIEF